MNRLQVHFGSCIIFILAVFFAWYMNRQSYVTEVKRVCYLDYEHEAKELCKPVCQHGQFGLSGMSACMPWLTCSDFRNIGIKKKIGGGAVKQVYLADWNGHWVTLNRLAEPLYKEDFHHGLHMLMAFQPRPLVTQLIGSCGDDYITEYHRHRSAEHLVELLKTEKFLKYDTQVVRFGFCINYVELLMFLHNSSHGIRVMCDSNDIQKTLNQLLVTDDLKLILNDLDALPEVIPPNIKIKCGHHQIAGDFVAPEQHWPYVDRPFDDGDMPPYDEKSDIWKIPDICLHFLGNVPHTRTLRFHLFEIHQKCKIIDPSNRASAASVLFEYKEVYRKLGL